MTDFFQTWAFFINQWDIQNTKFWDCNHLWCAIHDQNRAKKWADFYENWYTYRPNFWPLPRKILSKSDNFEATYHHWKLSDFKKDLRGNSQKFGQYAYQFSLKSDYFLAIFFHGGGMHNGLKRNFSPKSSFLSISLFEISDFLKKLCTCNLKVPFSQ